MANPIFLELDRVQAMIELRRFDDAASKLHELLGQDPENGMAWCLLVQAELGRKNLEAALEAADRAVAAEPDLAWAHRLRSVALSATGDHDEGTAAAFEAVKLAPDDWQSYSCLAQVLARVKARRDEAVAAGAYAVALAPHESNAHLTHGIASAARGKRKDAEAAFRRALTIDPQNGAAHNELARLRLRTSRFRDAAGAGRLADAAEGFHTAVQTDPHESASRRNLEVTLRTFLARLSYLLFAGAWLSWRWLVPSAPSYPGAPVSPPPGREHLSLLVAGLLILPAAYGWRFVSRLNPELRRHLRYTVTHGRIAAAAAIQLFAILVLLLTAVAAPAKIEGAAVVAVCLTLVARLLLDADVAKLMGKRLLSFERRRASTAELSFLAAVCALMAVLFAVGTAGSGFGIEGAVGVALTLGSGTVCVVMVSVIRRRRPRN